MSNQDIHGANPRARGSEGVTDWTARTAKDAMSGASSAAQDAAGKIKSAASDTAANLAGEVKQMLNHQVGGGADVIGYVARSARRAADDLERDSPQIAGLVRSLASRMDGYAGDLRDQSVDEILRTATDFTRRQPALVFGLAAVAGFFALRTLKSTTPLSAPPIQPQQHRQSHSPGAGGTGRQFHGA
ncbi:MAG: hypothetical protein ACJ8F3_20195 [Xanthobacteraceae bacterium]